MLDFLPNMNSSCNPADYAGIFDRLYNRYLPVSVVAVMGAEYEHKGPGGRWYSAIECVFCCVQSCVCLFGKSSNI